MYTIIWFPTLLMYFSNVRYMLKLMNHNWLWEFLEFIYVWWLTVMKRLVGYFLNVPLLIIIWCIFLFNYFLLCKLILYIFCVLESAISSGSPGFFLLHSDIRNQAMCVFIATGIQSLIAVRARIHTNPCLNTHQQAVLHVATCIYTNLNIISDWNLNSNPRSHVLL